MWNLTRRQESPRGGDGGMHEDGRRRFRDDGIRWDCGGEVDFLKKTVSQRTEMPAPN